MSLDPRPSSEVFGELPGGLATPELALPQAEGEPARIMEAVMRLADRLEDARLFLERIGEIETQLEEFTVRAKADSIAGCERSG